MENDSGSAWEKHSRSLVSDSPAQRNSAKCVGNLVGP
jgi:hypothetical protein